jgi:hypothetical protein
MSITYTPTTNFGSKDSLPSNDPNKVIKGAEFTTEFTAIQSAFGLAAPSSNPTFTGTATFDSVTANAVSLGNVTTSNLTVNGAFTSVGIDDNATSTAITIDANENVGIGETAPSEFLHISGAAPAMRLDNSSGTTDWLMQNVSDSMRWVSVPSGGGSSAERMRIDSDGNVGIGTDSPISLGSGYTNVDIRATTGGGLTLGDTSGEHGYLFSSSAELTLQAQGARDLKFMTDAVARLHIDSDGKVGIGTSDPNRTLTVSSASGVPAELVSSSTNSLLAFFDANTGVRPSLGSDGSDLVFNANGERMRIDATGNVGIGTTNPSTSLDIVRAGVQPLRLESTTSDSVQMFFRNTAGNAIIKCVGNDIVLPSSVGIGAAPSSIDAGQISLDAQGRVRVGRDGGTALQLNRTSSVGEVANFYYNGSQRGSIEVTDNGVALSGGSSASEHLTIDGSGNVGIGTTAGGSSSKLTVADSNTSVGLEVIPDAANNRMTLLSYDRGASAYKTFNIHADDFTFKNDGVTESFRIDSSGNVGIGTDAPITALTVADTGPPEIAIRRNAIGSNNGSIGALTFGAYATGTTYGVGATILGIGKGNWSAANQGSELVFKTTELNSTSDTERMRIDSSGNLLVGTTSAIGTAENAKTGATTYQGGAIANCRDSVPANVFLSKIGQLNGEYLFFARDGNGIGNIDYNGSVMRLNTTSDERLKKNIAPAGSALDVIKGIEVVSHDWTDDSKTHVEWGVLAQQVNGFLPSAVTEGSEDVNDKPWMVSKDSFVIPMLKAMQEQQAMIEDLKAEVEALKNA